MQIGDQNSPEEKDYDPIDTPFGQPIAKLVYYLFVFPLWWVAEYIAGLFFAEALWAFLLLALCIVGIELLLIILLFKYLFF